MKDVDFREPTHHQAVTFEEDFPFSRWDILVFVEDAFIAFYCMSCSIYIYI